jgi:hypothetical protein
MRKDIPYVGKLRQELVTAAERAAEEKPRTGLHLRRAMVGGGLALMVGVVAATWFFVLSPMVTSRAPERSGIRVTGGHTTRCAVPFSIQSLRDVPGYAFDGTVTDVIQPTDPMAEEGAATTEVVFVVTRWFKGGPGLSKTLKTYDLQGPVPAEDGAPPLEVGARILAAGDDGFLWGCGFSLPYSAENLNTYEQAFG